ncbi:MAG: hypothetical protein U1F43_29890 [Myxococcota bacterium]
MHRRSLPGRRLQLRPRLLHRARRHRHRRRARRLQALYVQDDNPVDGVEWQADQGAAWFGDPTTGTYASRPPPRAVAGALWTTTFTLPSGDRPLALDLDLSLSTEWDLGDPVDPGEVGAFTNPAGLDRLSVELIDGQYTTELWNSDALGGSTHGAVVPVRIDLGPGAVAPMALHIRFDSGDAPTPTTSAARASSAPIAAWRADGRWPRATPELVGKTGVGVLADDRAMEVARQLQRRLVDLEARRVVRSMSPRRVLAADQREAARPLMAGSPKSSPAMVR